MRPLTFLRSILWVAVALPIACSGGAERRQSDDDAAAQPAGWHRAETGSTAVPLSRPAGSAATTASEGRHRSIGFAAGLPSDTTGILLPRDFDASADPALVDRYLLYLPPGIDAGRQWPLILYLHGRSLRGDQLSLLIRYGLPARLEDDRDFPFVVVAPQLPGDQSWTDTDRLADLVREVAARYPVDPARIYLTGYSLGGGGVWRVAIDHPELFAAAAPVAAWTPEPSEEIARALIDLPIRIYHGTADEAAPFGRAEAMADALQAARVDVTFSVFPGVDHGELTHIYREDDLYAWLLARRRASPER